MQWLNWIVRELWPKAQQAVEKFLIETVVPDLNKNLPMMFRPVQIKKFNFGDVAPELGPLRTYGKVRQENKGVEIDVHVKVDTDIVIDLHLGSFPVGIKHLTLKFEPLCIVLRPLLSAMPIVCSRKGLISY